MLSKLIPTRLLLSVRLSRLSSYFFAIWQQHRHVTYLLKSVGRSSMKLDNENMYLFIDYNMPPLAEWNPRPAVVYWMNQKSRRARQRTRGKGQLYFKRVFCGGYDNCRKEAGFRFGG